MSAYRVQMWAGRIDAVKNWPEPKSVRNIQVFLDFANFYRYFIQGFNKIAGPFISMLRISNPTGSSTILQSIDVAEKDEVGESDGNRTNLLNPSASTRSTGAGYLTSEGAKKSGDNTKKGVKAARGSDYLTPATKKAFNHLRHAFIQVPIFQYFDPEWHIRIETLASDYAISGVLSELTLDNSGQWHPMAYYLQKMIPAKTWYKVHNGEFWTIVEVFKTCRHYLEG